jgi:hypothetical protein
VNFKDGSGRNGRYFIASTLIVIGLACAALLTNSVGNDLATVLIGVGLIMFVAFLFQDLGLSASTRSAPRVPPLPPEPASPEPVAAEPEASAPRAARAPGPAAPVPRSAAESARLLSGRELDRPARRDEPAEATDAG